MKVWIKNRLDLSPMKSKKKSIDCVRITEGAKMLFKPFFFFWNFFTLTRQTEYFPDPSDLFSHIPPEMSPRKEDVAKETEKVMERTFCPSHSKRTYRISLLLEEPLGNSARLPIGGKGDTRAAMHHSFCLNSIQSQSAVEKRL